MKLNQEEKQKSTYVRSCLCYSVDEKRTKGNSKDR